MLRSAKKAMLVGAVVAVSALGGAATASAAAWDVDGVSAGAAPGVPVEGSGTFGFSANLGGPVMTTTCDVAVEADVWNTSGVGAGSLTAFDVDPSTCVVTGVPNCTVISVVPTMPWTVATSGTAVTFGNVSFTYTLVGTGCALAGSRVVAGTVTGTWSNPGILNFSNATGLSWGGVLPLTTNANFGFAAKSGGDLYLQ